jgi:hypothetical protein
VSRTSAEYPTDKTSSKPSEPSSYYIGRTFVELMTNASVKRCLNYLSKPYLRANERGTDNFTTHDEYTDIAILAMLFPHCILQKPFPMSTRRNICNGCAAFSRPSARSGFRACNFRLIQFSYSYLRQQHRQFEMSYSWQTK